MIEASFVYEGLKEVRRRIESLEKGQSNIGGRIYAIEGDVKSLEKWRGEHDPIYEDEKPPSIAETGSSDYGNPNSGVQMPKDDPQRETREIPHGLEIGDLAPSRERKDIEFCPECGCKL